MKKRSKVIIIILVIVTPIIGYLLYYLSMFIMAMAVVEYQVKQVNERIVSLLYKTDHKALLDACRKVMEEAREGEWTYDKMYFVAVKPYPDARKLPEPILRLAPVCVMINTAPDRVVVQLEGTFECIGVVAYHADFDGAFYDYGDKELLDGLWYYDDGYDEVPDYEKKIQSLKPSD